MKMSMRDNAVSSIRLGVEDYKAASLDEARALSAIRNLSAGLLLLFKVKLQELSPPGSEEALLKDRVMPVLGVDGVPMWVGKGGKTVDVESIIKRLESLGIKGIDWGLLRKLTELRNDVEHYYSSHPTSGLLEAMAASFHLIQQFVPLYLNTSPLQLLGTDVWTFLTEQEAFYNREHKICQLANQALKWPLPLLVKSAKSLHCPSCRSELIKPRLPIAQPPDTTFECTSCGTVSRYENAVEVIVAMHLYSDLYIAATQGGEPPIGRCQRCNHRTYIFDDAFCAICQEDSPDLSCRQCGGELDRDDSDDSDDDDIDPDNLCGHCRYLLEMD